MKEMKSHVLRENSSHFLPLWTIFCHSIEIMCSSVEFMLEGNVCCNSDHELPVFDMLRNSGIVH